MNFASHHTLGQKRSTFWPYISILLILLLFDGRGLHAAATKVTKFPTDGLSSDATIDAPLQPIEIRAYSGMLHELPDPESVILKKLRQDDLVVRLFKAGSWYAVKLPDDRLGWVHQKLLDEDAAPVVAVATAKQKFIRKYVQVMVRTARVRSMDSFQATIAFRLPKNTRVAVTDIRGEWYFIHTEEGQRGWLHQIFVSDVDPSQRAQDAKVTPITPAHKAKPVMVAQGAMYERPTIDSKILTMLAQGQSVVILDTEADWYLVKTDTEKIGWMHQRIFETPVGPSQLPPLKRALVLSSDWVQVAVNIGRIRTAPDLKAAILARLDKGSRVERVAVRRDWYQVRLADNRLGWGHRILFKEVAAEASPDGLQTTPETAVPLTDPGALTRSVTSLRFAEAHADGIEQMIVLLAGEPVAPPEISLFEGQNSRVVCEFNGVRLDDGIRHTLEATGKFVRRIRIAQQPEPQTRVRVVLDLHPGIQHEIQQFFYPEDKKFKLVFLPPESDIKVK